MPSIVPFPIHKCYLFFSFLNMTSHPHSTSKWNGRTFLMQGRCWLYICIWRYSEIKDYTFGQEPRGGPTTGVNRLCWCLWCWFCLWWFLGTMSWGFDYLKVQWDQGLHIWSGAQRRPNHRFYTDDDVFVCFCWWLLQILMRKKRLKILTQFPLRTLQPDRLEGEHSAWCWSR